MEWFIPGQVLLAVRTYEEMKPKNSNLALSLQMRIAGTVRVYQVSHSGLWSLWYTSDFGIQLERQSKADDTGCQAPLTWIGWS